MRTVNERHIPLGKMWLRTQIFRLIRSCCGFSQRGEPVKTLGSKNKSRARTFFMSECLVSRFHVQAVSNREF